MGIARRQPRPQGRAPNGPVADLVRTDDDAPAKKLALDIDAAEWVPSSDMCPYLSSSTPLTTDDGDRDHTFNVNASLPEVSGVHHSDESQPWLQYASTKKSKLAQPANDRATNARQCSGSAIGDMPVLLRVSEGERIPRRESEKFDETCIAEC